MMKLFRTAAFIFLFAIISSNASAWGVLGHRIVGQIADSYLTAKAKAEIKKILGDESIAMSSNWADFIKSDTIYRYLYNWHFINFEKGMSKDQINAYLKTDTAVDVYTKMNFLVKELKKKSLPLETKKLYLRLIIHFVGDIHQPLHIGRPVDRGGNGIKVQWFSTATNLHSVWDESLVNFQQLSYTEFANVVNHTTARQRKQWQGHSLSEWITESYFLAENIYGDIKEDNQRLGYEYNFKYVQTLNQQLLKGGVRLAGLLNSIFK